MHLSTHRLSAVMILTVLLAAAPALGALITTYDVTKDYTDAGGSLTFDQYQPPSPHHVQRITIVSQLTNLRDIVGTEIDNDDPTPMTVHIAIAGQQSTVTSADVTVVPPLVADTSCHYSFILPAHDDPDGIDLIGTYEEDSGDDWVRLSVDPTAVVTRVITDPAEITAFVGGGTFAMDYVVTSEDGDISDEEISGSVRVLMEIPEPATMSLMTLAALGLLARKRRRR